MKRMLMAIALLTTCMVFSSCSLENTTEKQSISSIPSTDTPIREFSLATANTTLPDNVIILKEVRYYGAPGYFPPCEEYLNAKEDLEYMTGENLLVPTIVSDPNDTELMLTSDMATCGWESGEKLNGTITYPDGRTKIRKIIADEYFLPGQAILDFQPSISDSEGIYKFAISNGHITLESNAYFHYPDVPRVYKLNNQLVFVSFLPNETLRLFLYASVASADEDVESAWEFVAWSDIKVDGNGFLGIDAPDNDHSFVAITSSGDEYSVGQIGIIQRDYYDINWGLVIKEFFEHLVKPNEGLKSKEDPNCLDQTQVPDGIHCVRVMNSDIILYSQPRTTARIVTKFQVSQIIYIRKQICVENLIWWETEFDVFDYGILSGSGYVLETGDGNFIIEVIEN